jgi:chlorophyllide a reductase subunit Z
MLDELIDQQPVLVRISAAKRVRERAEREARKAGDAEVTPAHVSNSRSALYDREPA